MNVFRSGTRWLVTATDANGKVVGQWVTRGVLAFLLASLVLSAMGTAVLAQNRVCVGRMADGTCYHWTSASNAVAYAGHMDLNDEVGGGPPVGGFAGGGRATQDFGGPLAGVSNRRLPSAPGGALAQGYRAGWILVERSVNYFGRSSYKSGITGAYRAARRLAEDIGGRVVTVYNDAGATIGFQVVEDVWRRVGR